jgi:hypothetical protein
LKPIIGVGFWFVNLINKKIILEIKYLPQINCGSVPLKIGTPIEGWVPISSFDKRENALESTAMRIFGEKILDCYDFAGAVFLEQTEFRIKNGELAKRYHYFCPIEQNTEKVISLISSRRNIIQIEKNKIKKLTELEKKEDDVFLTEEKFSIFEKLCELIFW